MALQKIDVSENILNFNIQGENIFHAFIIRIWIEIFRFFIISPQMQKCARRSLRLGQNYMSLDQACLNSLGQPAKITLSSVFLVILITTRIFLQYI